MTDIRGSIQPEAVASCLVLDPLFRALDVKFKIASGSCVAYLYFSTSDVEATATRSCM